LFNVYSRSLAHVKNSYSQMNRRTSATLEREPAALDIQVVVGEFEGNIATSQLLVDRGEGVDLER